MARRFGHKIVGRGTELGRIARFLDDIFEGPSSLVIEGEDGIGKTTLWQAGVDGGLARGFNVLATRCGESETKLALAGLNTSSILSWTTRCRSCRRRSPRRSRPPSYASRLPARRRTAARSRSRRSRCFGSSPHRARSCWPSTISNGWITPRHGVLEFCARRIHDEQLRILAWLLIPRSDPDAPALAPAIPGAQVHRLAVGSMSRKASSAGSSAHGWRLNFPGRSCVAYTSRLAVIRSMPSRSRERSSVEACPWRERRYPFRTT